MIRGIDIKRTERFKRKLAATVTTPTILPETQFDAGKRFVYPNPFRVVDAVLN
jgi:hypothetical protein